MLDYPVKSFEVWLQWDRNIYACTYDEQTIDESVHNRNKIELQ